MEDNGIGGLQVASGSLPGQGQYLCTTLFLPAFAHGEDLHRGSFYHHTDCLGLCPLGGGSLLVVGLCLSLAPSFVD